MMFRLDVNQEKGELCLSWLNDKKEEKKLFTSSDEKPSRTEIVEKGLIPSSAVFKQTKRATLEWDDGCRDHRVFIERVGVKGEFSWPKEWDFKLTEDDVTEVFRAPTPDCVLAYEYYFNQVKKEILQHQLNLKPQYTGLF